MLICTDCGIVAANNDATGIADEDLDRVLNGVSGMGNVAFTDDTVDFSKAPCDSCGSPLAGYRYEVVPV